MVIFEWAMKSLTDTGVELADDQRAEGVAEVVEAQRTYVIHRAPIVRCACDCS